MFKLKTTLQKQQDLTPEIITTKFLVLAQPSYKIKGNPVKTQPYPGKKSSTRFNVPPAHTAQLYKALNINRQPFPGC